LTSVPYLRQFRAPLFGNSNESSLKRNSSDRASVLPLEKFARLRYRYRYRCALSQILSFPNH
jgi:hypothetical protein